MAKVIQIWDDVCGYTMPKTFGTSLEIRDGYEEGESVKACFILSVILPFTLPEETFEDYGKRWRMWDSGPTHEERRATPWN